MTSNEIRFKCEACSTLVERVWVALNRPNDGICDRCYGGSS